MSFYRGARPVVPESSNATLPSYDTLVFSGGGVKGSAYGGVLHALRKHLNIDWGLRCPAVNTIVGCSIGSIVALLLVLGYSVAEVQHVIDEAVVDSFLTIQPVALFTKVTLGLDDGSTLRDYLANLIHNKLQCGVDVARSMTLASLCQRQKMELHISATNMNTQTLTVFKPETHGSVSIVDAIYASCALPPIFAPIVIQDVLYADGGILDSFPISYYCDRKLLGFRLLNGVSDAVLTDLDVSSGGGPSGITPLVRFLQSVFHLSSVPSDVAMWFALPETVRSRVITIACDGISSLSVADLQSKKRRLASLGEQAVLAAFEAWKTQKMPPDAMRSSLGTLPPPLQQLIEKQACAEHICAECVARKQGMKDPLSSATPTALDLRGHFHYSYFL